jgi:hypothetical protein
MSERGVIRNRAAAQQIKDFSGLRYGKITPTDIDGFIDFGDRLFVLIEGKFNGAILSGGQMLALQRLTDACHCPPRRYAVAFIVDHYQQGADVDYANATVRTYRWGGTWRNPLQAGLTLGVAIERMRKFAQPVRLVAGNGGATC